MGKRRRKSLSSGKQNKALPQDSLQPQPVPIWVHYDRPLPDDKHVLAYPGVKQALGKLEAVGVDRVELLNRLRVVVLLHRPECAVLKRGDWAEGSGHNRRTIQNAPARFRNIAEEIERINAHPLLAPEIMCRVGSLGNSHRQGYKALPELLRSYSHALEGQARWAARQVAALARDRNLSDKLEAHLPEWTSRDGKYFYSELAELLTATFHADGQAKTVDPDTLKILHERSRQLWRRPRVVEVSLDASSRVVQLSIEV